jgi:hypothetical protein
LIELVLRVGCCSIIVVGSMVLAAGGCGRPDFSTAENEALFVRVCSTCHSPPVISEYPFDSIMWTNVLSDHRINNGMDTVATQDQIGSLFLSA